MKFFGLLVVICLLSTGVLCQRPFFDEAYPNYPCKTNPCQNGGECVLSKTKDLIHYTCNCPSGFLGNNCEAKQICSTSSLPTMVYPASIQLAGFAHGTAEIIAISANEIIPQEIVLALRSVALVTYATFNGAAPYFSNATKDVFGNFRTKPVAERTHDNMNMASFYAGIRILEYIFRDSPNSLNVIRQGATARGMDFSLTEACMSTPWGIGNLVGNELTQYAMRDGFNSEGDVGRTHNPVPFDDWTRFVPTNSLFNIKQLTKWVPLLEPSGSFGYNVAQNHIIAHAGSVQSFSLTRNKLNNVHVSPRLYGFTTKRSCLNVNTFGCNRLRRDAESVISAMNNLTDTTKMIAEHYDNKIVSLGFILFQFHQQIPLGHEDLTVLPLAFDAVLYDAMIVAWRQKIVHNNVRPVTVIQDIFRNSGITTWAKGHGTNTNIRGKEFKSYLRTMPHTEYPSGTACFCQAATEFYQQFFQTNNLSQQHLFPAGSSRVEPGATPSADLPLFIGTLSEMNEICGVSRFNAGVHFMGAVTEGKRVCSGIAASVLQKISMLLGRPAVRTGI